MTNIMQTTLGALALTTIVGAGGPAVALSCLPHAVQDVYKRVAEAKDRYLVVHGVLSFDESLLPKMDMENQQNTPQQTLIPAEIKGHFMTAKGFVTPIDTALTLDMRCLGPWCGGAKSGTPYLAFLKETEKGYELMIEPCGGDGFGKPDATTLEAVMQCHDGGPCDGAMP